MPKFLGEPAPLSKAVDAIERGVGERAPKVWAPRWVGAALYLRTLIQPLAERRALADPTSLAEVMNLSQSSGETDTQDPLLGVAVRARSSAGVAD
jgi:hypothetical protein